MDAVVVEDVHSGKDWIEAMKCMTDDFKASLQVLHEFDTDISVKGIEIKVITIDLSAPYL
ncbi:hypothetical protein AAG906_020046 [Vitis piasezkii]